jgi:hypothetical protein
MFSFLCERLGFEIPLQGSGVLSEEQARALVALAMSANVALKVNEVLSLPTDASNAHLPTTQFTTGSRLYATSREELSIEYRDQ